MQCAGCLRPFFMNTISIQFPADSAARLGLPPQPGGIYQLTWMELGLKLLRLTGDARFTNFQQLERQLSCYFYAQQAAHSLLEQHSNWQTLAYDSGLLFLLEQEEIEHAQAQLWLNCLCHALCLERYNQVQQGAIQGQELAQQLAALPKDTLVALSQQNAAPDEPNPLARAIPLYLRLSGQARPIDPSRQAEPADHLKF